jgi:hypothetical protein
MPATEGIQATAEKPATAGMTPTEGMAPTAGMEAAPCLQETNWSKFWLFRIETSFEGHPHYAHPYV